MRVIFNYKVLLLVFTSTLAHATGNFETIVRQLKPMKKALEFTKYERNVNLKV